MKAQFSHEVFASFYLWFESQLSSSDLAAYTSNVNNKFNYSAAKDIPSGYYGYQGLFRQIVTDYSIAGPNSGIFINGNFVTGSSNNVLIDYANGRVIVPQASGTGLTITANNSVREVSLYPTEDDEQQIIISSDFIDSTKPASTYLSDKTKKEGVPTYILPACFVRLVSTDNESFTFGGEEDSKTRINVTVIGMDNFTVDAILSFFSDSARTCIKQIPFASYPYGYANTIKNFPYSYDSLASGFSSTHFIEKAKTSKVSGTFSHDKLQKNLVIGFIDFDLSTHRYPRL